MNKEFIPYQQALELKELGFDEPCFRYIYIGDTGNNCHHYIEVEPSKGENFNVKPLCISQPTFSQAFSFFREKCGISFHISDYYGEESRKLYGRAFQIFINGRQQSFDYSSSSTTELYFTYPEAELACLIKLIEIVKNSK
jgi:hypothetical protein